MGGNGGKRDGGRGKNTLGGKSGREVGGKERHREGDATWVTLEVETLESPRNRLLAEGKVPVGPRTMGGVSVIGIGRVPAVRQRTAVCVSWM